MTDCQGCAKPASGLYVSGCRGCALRNLAAGPMFWASMKAGKLTPEYVAALRELGEPAEVHLQVRDAAKHYDTGATRA